MTVPSPKRQWYTDLWLSLLPCMIVGVVLASVVIAVVTHYRG